DAQDRVEGLLRRGRLLGAGPQGERVTVPAGTGGGGLHRVVVLDRRGVALVEDDLGGGQGGVVLPGAHVVGAAFGGTRPGVVGPELGVVVLGIGLDDVQVRRLPGDLGSLGQYGAEFLATKADPHVMEY